VANLYASYSRYTTAARETVETMRRFSERVQSLGYERERRGKTQDRGFRGITLRAQSDLNHLTADAADAVPYINCHSYTRAGN
jgi:hypothetical protein